MPLEAFSSHLDRRVPELLERYEIPGASLALVFEGRVAWAEAWGEADRRAARPMTADTVFQVASISKTVAAWAVLRLVEQGRLDLDAPAGRYLTRWKLPNSEFDHEDVTLRRLLSHSGGVAHAIHSHRPPEVALPTIEEALSGDGGVEEPAHLVQAPGSAFLYSNAAYAILQLLIEEVTDLPFEQYLGNEILSPLGMKSSSFVWDDSLRPRTATGYDFCGAPMPHYLHAAKAAGGLHSTAHDLARFAAATMPDPGGDPPGRGVLSPESVALLQTPVIETRGLFALASDAYALGYFVETLPGGEQAVMHGGENAGWISQFYAVPETGDGIVILTNSERSHRFVSQVTGDWARWRAFPSVKMSRSIEKLAAVLGGTAALLALLTLGLTSRLVAGFRSGARRFEATTRGARRRRLCQAALAALILALWWHLGHGFTRIWFPVLTGYLDASASACAGLLLLLAVFPTSEADSAQGKR
jgi:CubicO group peptidase (beta-lactamase class C family)